MKTFFFLITLIIFGSVVQAAPQHMVKCDSLSREFISGFGQLETIILIMQKNGLFNVLNSNKIEKNIAVNLTSFIEGENDRIKTFDYKNGQLALSKNAGEVLWVYRGEKVNLKINREARTGQFSKGSKIWKLGNCEEGYY